MYHTCPDDGVEQEKQQSINIYLSFIISWLDCHPTDLSYRYFLSIVVDAKLLQLLM